MSILLEKPKKKTTKKTTSLVISSKETKAQEPTQEDPAKKKTLWDIAEELAKNPLCTIDEKDRDLIYGSNMMTKLLQEEEL